MKHKSQNGQMLVEATIAISILVMGLFGIINLLNQSLGLNVIVTSQYIGSNLAMEGVEVVKNLIDTNVMTNANSVPTAWNKGINNGEYRVDYTTKSLDSSLRVADKIKLNSSNGLYNYSTGNDTNFTRKVQISNICNLECDEIQVNSIVSWKIKGGTHEINVEDHFFNWRKEVAPTTP